MTTTEDASDETPDQTAAAPGDDPYPEVPDWDDEYVDRVSDRLMFNYDLSKDRTVGGQRFTLVGEMEMENYKQFLHPSIRYGHHELYEYLLVARIDHPTVADFERLVELGHDLSDEWVEGHEEHYQTDFTFAVVADELGSEIRSFVESFRERTLLKYGYHGHYEIHLVAVAPEHEDLVTSARADAADAFRVWDAIDERAGLVTRLKRRLLG